MRGRGLLVLAGAALIVAGLVAAGYPARAHGSGASGCAVSYPRRRDAANPLMIAPAPPASDPLRGAKLWVAGPSHSAVAGAILHLLGIDTGQALGSGDGNAGVPLSESWTSFAGWLQRRLPHYSAQVRYAVDELEKSASHPFALRISAFSGGGSPSAVYAQMEKFVCTLAPEDPGSVFELSTYFLQPTLGGCASTASIDAYAPKFEAQIDAVARAIGTRPMIIFAEEDAVGASQCMVGQHSLGAWERLLRYEVTTLEARPHTVVYLEGGYSDAEAAGYTASVLNASGIRGIEGFFTNDTHYQWDTNELRYAQQVSRLTAGAHYVINTADNGQGPLLNPDPVTEGIEELCNPPGRGLGIAPTTDPQLPARYRSYRLDAFLWTYTPGYSSGTCNGGPPGGQYWLSLGVRLGHRANGKLGPGYPSKPW